MLPSHSIRKGNPVEQDEMRFSPDQLVFKVGILSLENERLRDIVAGLKQALREKLDAPCEKHHCDDCECCECEADGACCSKKEED